MDAYAIGSNEIEIQTQSARLGEGFNSLNLSRRHDSNWFQDDQNPFKEVILETPQTVVQFEIAETSYELTNKLGINAEMAASYADPAFSAGVETTANYVKEESFTNKSFVLFFHGKAISRRASLPSNPKLNPLALSYLSNSKQLLDTFGDYYCSELIYGGELVILVTITVQDATKKDEIKTKLSAFVKEKVSAIAGSLTDNLKKKDESKKEEKTADGKTEDKKEEEGAGARLSFEVRKEFNEITKDTQTKVDIYQVGSYETPKDTTFPTYLEYAFNYFNQDHVNNLMRAVYRPVTQLPILDQDSKPSEVLQNLAAELKPAWEKRDTFLSWLGEYQQAVHDYEEAYHNGKYYFPQAYYDLVYKDLTDLEKKAAKKVASFDGTTKFSDPEKFIRGQKRPVDFQTKLAKRKIQALGPWGGNGGGEYNDSVNNLTGITRVTVTWDDRAGTPGFLSYAIGGIIGTIETRYKTRDDKDYVILHGTHPPDPNIFTIDYHQQSRSFSLDKGDYIEAIEVWSDHYVRQITFWVRRKETRALEKQGPFPPIPNPKSRWGGVERHYKENIILLAFKTRSGSWIDALGIYYIDR